jgi:hypothetical protein
MVYPKTYREEAEEADRKFSTILFEIENAVLAFFTEGKTPRLGTLAVALPLKRKSAEPALSSTLLGERSQTITRILAERLAIIFNKIALVSTFAETIDENSIGRIFMKLVERVSKKRGQK